MPVYELLGGQVRDRVRMYTWIGGDRPRDVRAQAVEKVKAGFTALKMNATEELDYIDSHAKIDAAVERVAAVREGVGREVGIAVDLFERRTADIIQPDISHAGGIWECRKIAAMAESYDVAVALHCPLGTIALAASLQLDACTPNAVIQEQSLRIHFLTG